MLAAGNALPHGPSSPHPMTSEGIGEGSHEREDAMATKILHTADWHLGLRFLRFGDHERKLTQRRLETVQNILGVAERFDVAAILVAGDVFDVPDPAETWWRPLVDLLARRVPPSRPVVLLPGNHDPLVPASIWKNRTFLDALPTWVHVVDRDDFTLALGDDAVIHAVPCRRTAGERDMAAALPSRTAGDHRVRIALLHGQVFGFPGIASNFPIALDTATKYGFDYVALGDTHGRRVHGNAEAPLVYPGTPEPTKFGEDDAGCVALALFGRRHRAPKVQFEAVGHFRWEERTVSSLAELRALEAEDHQRTVMRLHVAMTVGVEEHTRVEAALHGLAGTDAVPGKVAIAEIDRAALQLDTTSLLLALEDLPEQIRETARRLRARIEVNDRADVAEQALLHLYRLARQGVSA
jgi:DNA repair exonuclease SbcCD nuclease subunit